MMGMDKVDNTAQPRELLRFKVPYNNKLLPVYAVVELHGIGVGRWANDDYQVHIDESRVLTVTERASEQIVHIYNSNRWLSFWYEYQGQDYGWHKANQLVVIEEGSDDDQA